MSKSGLGRNTKKGGNPSTELYVLQVLNRIVAQLELLNTALGRVSILTGLVAGANTIPHNLGRTPTTVTAMEEVGGTYVSLDITWEFNPADPLNSIIVTSAVTNPDCIINVSV